MSDSHSAMAAELADERQRGARYEKALRAISEHANARVEFAETPADRRAMRTVRDLALAALAGEEGAGESAEQDLILIETRGDHSVGIHGECLTIRWPGAHALDNREEIREMLRRFWSEMLEEPAGVTFGDECPDCGQVGKHAYGCQEIPL